jgi:C1A family cysteine protease
MKIKNRDPHFTADLSVAHLFFCGAGENGCDEGWQIGQALKHCKKDGVGNESNFRYSDRQLPCQTITPCVRVTRWRRVKETLERKDAIRSRGPVVAGMVIYKDFGYYRSGVYRPTTADSIGLHAVSVIEYDDDKGCWIVKNSWGTTWGEGGFVRIGYGTCGIDAQFEFYDPEVELL